MNHVVYGVWNGGASYAPGYQDTDLERFDSIKAAAEALKSRAFYGGHHRQTFDYVHKPADVTYTPNADDGAHVWLYRTPEPDAEAFALLEYGPRGGVKRTNL